MDELDELDRQIAELQSKRLEIANAKRKTALEDVRKVIKQFSFTAAELQFSDVKGKTVKTKKTITYRDETTGNEWDGELTQKGRKPEWIRAKVTDGTIEQYRVKT